MYERILVPTDGSQGHVHVAMQAFDLAEQYGATVHLLYVVDEAVGSIFGNAAERKAELRTRGERALETLAELAAAYHLEPVREIREGDPGQAIVAYGDEIDADVIVMGTHGLSGIERRLIGSVAERVVRTAERPVMTIRLPESDRTVTDEAHAAEIAEDALDEAGFGAVDVEAVTQHRSVWVVEARGDDTPFVVYVDPVTQRTSVVSQREDQ